MKKLIKLVMLFTLSLGVSHFSYAHYVSAKNIGLVSTENVIFLTAKPRVLNSTYIATRGHQYAYQLVPTSYNKYSMNYSSRQYLANLASEGYLTKARSYWP